MPFATTTRRAVGGAVDFSDVNTARQQPLILDEFDEIRANRGSGSRGVFAGATHGDQELAEGVSNVVDHVGDEPAQGFAAVNPDHPPKDPDAHPPRKVRHSRNCVKLSRPDLSGACGSGDSASVRPRVG
jgi:hypothetical protein